MSYRNCVTTFKCNYVLTPNLEKCFTEVGDIGGCWKLVFEVNSRRLIIDINFWEEIPFKRECQVCSFPLN